LGEEYDEYQEEMMSPKEVLECYEKMMNQNNVDNVISTLPSANNMSEFLEWANDKISVVWSSGALCNNEPLEKFEPNSSESIRDFLQRIVDWVDEHEYHKDKYEDDEPNEYVFSFFNDSLDEEYDEYQEEMMNPKEVWECYEKMVN
jgi:DNA-binding Lrp family transcriptional regulator